ncbi:MAG: MATE family efflux transporter [Immundisolibacteraceae bacterium]|nr:MATE family efflux transporter [Immundisolibacteraceae bacterium]
MAETPAKTSTERRRHIFALALPIIGAMVSQSVLNLVDTAMVGQLGDVALAAVGLGGLVVFAGQAMVLGFSRAVQTMAAHRKGQNRLHESAQILNAALLIILLVSPLLSIVLVAAAPWFYPLLNPDPEVVAAGIPYFEVRIMATLFVGMNYAFRGYWNAIDRSRLYLTTLLVIHTSNILLNYILIFGHFGAPAMGVTGAGLASAIAVALGTATYFFLALRHARPYGFLQKLPPRADIRNLISQSIPNGINDFSFLAGFTALYWVIGQVGTPELAAASVIMNITLIAILPGQGFALAATSLVGQALGSGNTSLARIWVRDVGRLCVLTMVLIGLPMWAFPDYVLFPFIIDQQTLNLARLPLQIVGFTVTLEGLKMVLMHALIGAGDAHRVTRVALATQWLFAIPLSYLIGPYLGFGLLGIWAAQELYRVLQLTIYLRQWLNNRWADITF